VSGRPSVRLIPGTTSAGDRPERRTLAGGHGLNRGKRPGRGLGGPAEEVPLAELDLELLEDCPLRLGFDPLGDDVTVR
jgi:hypothetical protein